MRVRSILRRLPLPLLAVALFAPAALANPTLPWATAQVRGLDYEPYFLSAIQAPVFDPGANPGNSPRFGHSVALNNNVAVIGWPFFTSQGLAERGRTLAYRINAEQEGLVHEQQLLRDAAGEQCGCALACNDRGPVNDSHAA